MLGKSYCQRTDSLITTEIVFNDAEVLKGKDHSRKSWGHSERVWAGGRDEEIGSDQDL